MNDNVPIPPRIILANVAMVLLWVPLLFVARNLLSRVSASDPSDDLLMAARLAVIGTLIIITAVYLFGLVLINKFLTQNLGFGSQRRVVRPMLLAAVVLYVSLGVVLFG